MASVVLPLDCAFISRVSVWLCGAGILTLRANSGIMQVWDVRSPNRNMLSANAVVSEMLHFVERQGIMLVHLVACTSQNMAYIKYLKVQHWNKIVCTPIKASSPTSVNGRRRMSSQWILITTITVLWSCGSYPFTSSMMKINNTEHYSNESIKSFRTRVIPRSSWPLICSNSTYFANFNRESQRTRHARCVEACIFQVKTASEKNTKTPFKEEEPKCSSLQTMF